MYSLPQFKLYMLKKSSSLSIVPLYNLHYSFYWLLVVNDETIPNWKYNWISEHRNPGIWTTLLSSMLDSGYTHVTVFNSCYSITGCFCGKCCPWHNTSTVWIRLDISFFFKVIGIICLFVYNRLTNVQESKMSAKKEATEFVQNQSRVLEWVRAYMEHLLGHSQVV